jgi:hypothetical protein
MPSGRLDRIALLVGDLDSAMAQMTAIFDMTFVVLHADAMGLRVAIGESGLELVEKIASTPIPVEQIWRAPIASLEVRVDDVDAAIAAMRAAGYEVHHSLVTPGGVPKVQMGNAFHDLPMLLYTVPPGKSYVEAVTGRSAAETEFAHYTPDIDWAGRR